MSETRVSFVLDDSLLARVDARAASRELNRSEHLRDLLYKDLGELPPRETERTVLLRSTDWGDKKTCGLPGAPRFILYRSDGTFLTETLSSEDRLLTAEDTNRNLRAGTTALAWEKLWRSRMCQPVYVGPWPYVPGTPHPAAPWPECEILYNNPQAQYDNRFTIRVAPLDPRSHETFDEMVATLRESAKTWQAAQ